MSRPHDELVQVALRHSQAEGDYDMAATLATLEDEPVYELYPVGLKMTGMDMARRYYAHYFANVAPNIVAWSMISEWINDAGVAQEYNVTYRRADGMEKQFRILGILTFGEALLSGERIYADAELLEIMFKPLWAELTPIRGERP